MFVIRQAELIDFENIKDFYIKLMEALKDDKYRPQWQPGKYPSDDYIEQSINRKEFFIGLDDQTVAATLIINHYHNPAYNDIEWNVKADDYKIMYLHLLAVRPPYANKGYAKKMIAYALQTAKDKNQLAVRLDTLSGTIPAQNLYQNIGFKRLPVKRMYYESTGYADFVPYEYIL